MFDQPSHYNGTIAASQSFPKFSVLLLELANRIDHTRTSKQQLRTAATRIGVGNYGLDVPNESLEAIISKELSGGMTYLNALQKLVEIISTEAEELRGVAGVFIDQVPPESSTASGRY